MGTREFDGYSLEGMMALGEAIRHWREAAKPHWQPCTPLPPDELLIERGRWTQVKMAEVLNREYGLQRGFLITGDRLSRIEKPNTGIQEPPLRVLELIVGLNIMLNPKTNAPFTLMELLDVAKCRLDWRTGEPIRSCNENGVG